MFADIIFIHIKHLYTPFHQPPVRGEKMGEIHSFDDAFLAIKDGQILDFGTDAFQKYIDSNTEVIEATHQIILPGLIDSHTHLVFGGSREQETVELFNGVSYLDILKRGGGILSTVKATREASFEDLFAKAKIALNRMLSYGVTRIEAKSGYGLDRATEIKQMQVVEQLNRIHPITIHSTYLGAHAIPNEYKDNRSDYCRLVLNMMEEVKSTSLAEAIDVFFEMGVFNKNETLTFIQAAQKLGLKVHLHADEMTSLHAAALGVENHVQSIDHLMAISEEDILILKESDTVANILPYTSFFLGKSYAPARKMIDSGGCIAISSDFNPGSAPCENYQFSLQLALSKLHLTPSEILTAATINPAYHLGVSKQTGSIAAGKDADFVLIDCDNLDSFLVHCGVNLVNRVYKHGKCVFHQCERGE